MVTAGFPFIIFGTRRPPVTPLAYLGVWFFGSGLSVYFFSFSGVVVHPCSSPTSVPWFDPLFLRGGQADRTWRRRKWWTAIKMICRRYFRRNGANKTKRIPTFFILAEDHESLFLSHPLPPSLTLPLSLGKIDCFPDKQWLQPEFSGCHCPHTHPYYYEGGGKKIRLFCRRWQAVRDGEGSPRKSKKQGCEKREP